MSYVIPIAEIISCLTEVGIRVKSEDLLQPEEKKENVKRIFEQLAEICLGIAKEEMSQATFTGLQAMSYPELHEESIPQMNCFRILQQLFERYGVKDFCLNDITCPSPRRLRIQLSHAVNFLKYREERLASLAEHDNQRVALNTQLLKAQSLYAEKEKSVAMALEKKEEQAEYVNKMEADCKEMEGNISELNIRQAEIREYSSELKAKNNERKDSVAAKKLQLEELQALKRQLQGQIVTSPEKLKKQLDDTNASLHSQNTEIKSCEKKLKELNAWNECISNAAHDIKLAKEAIDGFAVELGRSREAQATVGSKEQQILSHKDVLKVLQQNNQQLNRKALRQEEKNATTKQHADQRGLDATATMDKLQNDIIRATNLKNDVKMKVEAHESELATMKKLVESERNVQEQVFRCNNEIVLNYCQILCFVISRVCRKSLTSRILITAWKRWWSTT